MQNGESSAMFKETPPKLATLLVKNKDKIIATWNHGE
jgi:hypothetical protein